LQNATARRLGVPDLTTTVLTLTLTGLAADSKLAGGRNTRPRGGGSRRRRCSPGGRRRVRDAVRGSSALIALVLVLQIVQRGRGVSKGVVNRGVDCAR